MHTQSETTNLSDDTLRIRTPTRRSVQPPDPRHRRPSGATEGRSREGQQRTTGADLAQTADGTARILERVSTDAVPLSRQDTRSPVRFDLDPKSVPSERIGSTRRRSYCWMESTISKSSLRCRANSRRWHLATVERFMTCCSRRLGRHSSKRSGRNRATTRQR